MTLEQQEATQAARERIDRRTRMWPAVQAVTLFIILFVGSAGLMYGYATSNSTEAIDHGNKLRECTTKESAKVTQAQTALIRAGQARDSATQEYLQATAVDDTVTAERLLLIAPDLRAKVATLSAELDAANVHYQDKLVQSRTDPDAFLSECDESD